MKIPEIEVGILSSVDEIHFQLNTPFLQERTGTPLHGRFSARCDQQKGIILFSEGREIAGASGFFFEPEDSKQASFDLDNVVIGIQFHWERKETQRFRGKLKVMLIDSKITAINVVSIEDYLLSVISSEMSAHASLELLKAHAVISRSWVLAQKEKSRNLQVASGDYCPIEETEGSYIRWYDREDHLHFDVCADDHCQRYQGITRSSTPTVAKAVGETEGEVLRMNGVLCDARFSKCCGGITERFEHVWEPVPHPYLQRVADTGGDKPVFRLDLKQEAQAKEWIEQRPPAFCNTTDDQILSQVLNDYDRETQDFFRWEVTYSQEELSRLITRKTNWEFGSILDLVPVERGESGRLIRLKIVGSKQTKVIGKELFIRKALAESHLYSSAFTIEKEGVDEGIPQSFTFRGAGWGHGVGLCQIGAAVMGAEGYAYRKILAHYFPGASIDRIY